MIDAINASTGRNSTTVRKIPQDVLTGAFASGFKLSLMTKDVGIAAELARGLQGEDPVPEGNAKALERCAEDAVAQRRPHRDLQVPEETYAPMNFGLRFSMKAAWPSL